MKQGFYEFEATSIQGERVTMDTYKGKVVLIVNTASKCGLTPQFEGLEKLYKTYQSSGLVILGFPCNQFANQEPGDKDAILETCQVNYGVSFPMFAKIEVNGKQAHPLFKYLKTNLKGTLGNKVKWNFTKFLIGSDGEPLKRFAPTTTPGSIEKYIQKALAEV